MKNIIFSSANKIILRILTLLGFSCCTFYACEYGTPSANFIASGRIIDEVTLQKLVNIEVVMKYDTVYSNEDGFYEIIVRNSPSSDVFTIHFNDIDSELNGKYISKDTIIDYSDIDFKNGYDDWYSGEKSKEINIKLSPDETL